MDTKENLLAVATSDRWIQIINLDNPTATYKEIQSHLKRQTRVVSCFPDGTEYTVGSIEGRCGFQYVNEKDAG